MTTDLAEAGLERLICEALTGDPCEPASGGTVGEPSPGYGGGGWSPGNRHDYDREYCVDLCQLRTFLHATQPEPAAALCLGEDREELDPKTLGKTLQMAQEEVEAVGSGAQVREVVADKGYDSNETVLELKELGLRGYLSETDRGRRNWKGKNRKYQAPVYANRRRIRERRGRRLQRQRSELVERPFAHQFTTGGLELTHFRGPLLSPFTLDVATKVGQLHLRRLLFVAIRRLVAQRRVPAPPVVESLNEVEDGSPRLVRIPELVTVQQLALDRREAEFAGVVPSEYAA